MNIPLIPNIFIDFSYHDGIICDSHVKEEKMSLIICIYVPTGIVLSGDSRTTGTLQHDANDLNNPDQTIIAQTQIVLSDFAEKVFNVFDKYGIGTFGDAFVNNLPIAHYIEKFEQENSSSKPKTAEDLTGNLLEYFRELNAKVGFIVAGYDRNIPFVFAIDVGGNTITQLNLNEDGNINYGIARGGETDIVNRLMSEGKFHPPFPVMNIQDAVDFSRHLIRSTIDQMRFEPRFASVGGDIDTLLVTAKGVKFLQKKDIVCK
jgi:20S proteasome alpha/beta subunit